MHEMVGGLHCGNKILPNVTIAQQPIAEHEGAAYSELLTEQFRSINRTYGMLSSQNPLQSLRINATKQVFSSSEKYRFEHAVWQAAKKTH